MAEITRHRQGEMVQALFKVLTDKPDGLQAREVIRQVESIRPSTVRTRR